jgi:hypothetical protein
MHFLFLSKAPLNKPLAGSSTGPLWRELPIYRAFFTSQIPHNNCPKQRNLFPSLEGRGRGMSLHVLPKRGPHGNRRPFPEPDLAAYLLGSPVEEPSLQISLIELPQLEIPHF